MEKQSFSLKLLSGDFYGQSFIKTVRGPLQGLTVHVHVYEPQHEISNNVICVTSKCSDQPAHTLSLIKAFAGHLTIL